MTDIAVYQCVLMTVMGKIDISSFAPIKYQFFGSLVFNCERHSHNKNKSQYEKQQQFYFHGFEFLTICLKQVPSFLLHRLIRIE